MTLFGPDGAAYQKGIKLTDRDWNSINFGLWRVIHQTGSKDATFDPMMKQFKEHNIPFAAYVFVDKMSAAAKSLYTAAALPDRSIPIMVDWEDPKCSFDNMCEFIDRMRSKGYKVPLLYVGLYFWKDMGSPRLDDLGVELVSPRYGDQKVGDKLECIPRYNEMLPKYSVWEWNLGGLNPVMWQFSSLIRWGDHYMDMSAILEQEVIDRNFKNWNPIPVPTPIPPGEEEMVDAEDINGVWFAPPIDKEIAPGGKNLVWLNAVIAKVGPVSDVQRRNGLKVTGQYKDDLIVAAYNKELAVMKQNAGV